MILGSLQTLLVFILVFAVLVFFHELGHFLFAKLFRMKVDEFALGMGNPKLRLYFDGETEYTLRAIPIGGFVRIAGMEAEDSFERKLTGAGATTAEHKESGLESTNEALLEQEAAEVSGIDPNGFNSRPIFQRFCVILAGPVFSFLLGWITLCLIGVTTGFPSRTQLMVRDAPKADTVAYAAGIRAGDAILGVRGASTDDSEVVLNAIRDSAGKPLVLTIQSADGGPTRNVTITPRAETVAGLPKPIGRIGISLDYKPLAYKRVGLGASFAKGTELVGVWFSTMTQLVRSGAIKDNVGGPVAIFKETHAAAQSGPMATMSLLGQLSLSLGLFNLLPIPILDGGHLLLMGVEAVRRRKLTVEQTNRVFAMGLGILAVLFVLIFAKDLTGVFLRR